MTAQTYKLTSVKGDRIIKAESDADAFRAARRMEEELQPAFGVDVECCGHFLGSGHALSKENL